jgi:hypothetical protein
VVAKASYLTLLNVEYFDEVLVLKGDAIVRGGVLLRILLKVIIA